MYLHGLHCDPLVDSTSEINGSAQEFEEMPILSHFPKNDEFGL